MFQRLRYDFFQFILNQIKEYWPYYLMGVICLFFTHYIQSYLPYYAKELADMASAGMEGISSSKFIFMALGIIVFRTSSRLLFFYPARVQQKNLRTELLSNLESSSPNRYGRFSNGQLFHILINDIDNIRAFFGFAFLQVGNILVAISVLMPRIIAFNPSLAICLLPIPITFLVFTAVVWRNRFHYRKIQDLQGEVQNFIIESYDGKRTIKNYHAESSFISLFRQHSLKELGHFYRAGLGISILKPAIPFAIGLSLLWGAYVIRQNDLGASSLIFFSGFVFLFLEPIMYLAWIGVIFSGTVGSWNRIKELVSSLDQESERELILRSQNTNNDVENFIVPFWEKTINLEIPSKSWTALVGKTGCGKSHILTELADILTLKGSKIAYVAQTPYLYNDTMFNNIFLGQKVSEEKKLQALELIKLFALNYLESKEQIFNMQVGEHGKKLSGGEAKRVCLIRSLMGSSDILIWDDPFSSIDVLLESKIVNSIKDHPQVVNKTVILSSHRLTTVKKSKQVIFVDKSEGIVETGLVSSILNDKSKVYEYFKDQLV